MSKQSKAFINQTQNASQLCLFCSAYAVLLRGIKSSLLALLYIYNIEKKNKQVS